MSRKIRYAVVGLGHIAQAAMLPAFKNAKSNSELTALVSGDHEKLTVLGKKYKVKHLFHYAQLDELFSSCLVDAVYISTPNVMHSQIAEMAAKYGVHILTEKPMASMEHECLNMMRAARNNKVKLMVAYRLHFDPANLAAVEMAKTKQLGELKMFNSTFTNYITDRQNIRLKKDMGGGPMWDIGIYCLNASRYLFQDEPTEVFAMKTSSPDPRFREIEEMMVINMRFPKDRLATFNISYGAAASAAYDLIGTKGRIHLENAYSYAEEMTMTTVIADKKKGAQIQTARSIRAGASVFFRLHHS